MRGQARLAVVRDARLWSSRTIRLSWPADKRHRRVVSETTKLQDRDCVRNFRVEAVLQEREEPRVVEVPQTLGLRRAQMLYLGRHKRTTLTGTGRHRICGGNDYRNLEFLPYAPNTRCEEQSPWATIRPQCRTDRPLGGESHLDGVPANVPAWVLHDISGLLDLVSHISGQSR